MPRQTQSYLRGLFAQRGISPRHRMGQNFLIDLNIHELIVETAGVGEGDLILEVGPGAGALTTLMAGRGAEVVAVELDPALARLTSEAVADFSHVRVLNVDALASKNALDPTLAETIQALLASSPRPVFKLVANLPYNVATPIIANLLVDPLFCPALMVVTIQRELADRMIALPGSSAYGALSVIVQALAECAIVRVLQPSVFWPRPKVESAVVLIRPDLERRAGLDVAWFHAFVRKVFLHRRKNLRHVLADIWKDRWTKSEVDGWLASFGLDGRSRAESFSIDQFRSLAEALRVRWGQDAGTGLMLEEGF
ncbi:MAG: 16S rRNA (adenine(1518)-N(6)/adenine(1519)-N(6))-dimethyltransferase RsmA [Isosphaeraceae bacterium]